jgi:hypothetical protein
MLIGCILICYKTFSQSSKTSLRSVESLPTWFRSQAVLHDYDGIYSVSGAVDPNFLEADFNGQGHLDIAVFIVETKSLKKGILIQHREDNTMHILGAGTSIGTFDDFSWMDHWQINMDSTAEETVFSENFDIVGSKTVQITNIAIEVSSRESPSNLIVWNETKYFWIHTGD